MPIPSYFCLICAVSLLSATVMAEVQIYGRASLSHDNIAGYSDGRANQYISSNSSRIGFRGDEALGDDYRGLFQIEVPLGMDDGAGGGFAGRDSFVGIANRFGSLRFGGETLTGEQALQLGLVQWSVPRAALPAAAQALAERAAQVPRYTLAENKRCIALAASAPGEGYAAEIAATRRLYENPETRRRVTAFLDKNAAPTKEQA